jgi:DNA-directed RNA polymerase specialized sigma24 family protein
MNMLVPENERTNDAHLADWEQFCLAYYEPIQRTFRLLGVPEGEIADLTQSFLLKVGEKNFLDTFHAFRDREMQSGRRARFRTYLYRSLQHHVVDFHRQQQAQVRACDMVPAESALLAAKAEPALDPDALYALDVLHQALQALRTHCERTGKFHYWVFFEETFLADEFRNRRRKTRAELLEMFPSESAQDFDNALTTAKRAFRRFVHDVIPRSLRDDVSPARRFEEWMEILRNSSTSQFNLLHLAYRVTPHLSEDMSQADSLSLVVSGEGRSAGARQGTYEEPVLVPSNDEMSILLSFRLEVPLIETLDVAELQRFIPPSSALWPIAHGRVRRNAGSHPGLTRPLCLLTLIAPSAVEEAALAEVDMVGLLGRLKSFAKQLHRRPDHSVPEAFAQLIYTTVSLLALIRYKTNLHTIGLAPLAGNVRWFLEQPWLDDRLRPLLSSGLTVLENPSQPGLE